MERRRVLRRHLEADRLKSQRVRAYLQPAEILTDILTYAIWWRLFYQSSLNEHMLGTELQTLKT